MLQLSAVLQEGASLCTSQKRETLGEQGASFLSSHMCLVSAYSLVVPKLSTQHPPAAVKEVHLHPWCLKWKKEAHTRTIRGS